MSKRNKNYSPVTPRTDIISDQVRSSIDADILQQKAMVCVGQNCFEEAEQLLQQALMVREQALGNTHRKLVPILNNLALNCSHLGKYDQAVISFERALEILEKNPKQDQYREMELLENYVHVLRKAQREQDCLKIEQRLALIKEKYDKMPAMFQIVRHITPSITMSALKVAELQDSAPEKRARWPMITLIALLSFVFIALLILFLQQ